MINGKYILDVCCGSRMFWFDKNNPAVLFCDIRKEDHILCDGRKLNIDPDVIADFRDLPFADGQFKMVVFDPPHMIQLGESSWMAKKYGKLNYTWKDDIRAGFSECMRVLEPFGTLIFKWNESEIKSSDVLNLIPYKPLFGHTTGRQSKTIWIPHCVS